jgi:molybdopterin/thiamine biosynthesis adenylyltransferase
MGRTVIVVGLGNIGSHVAPHLPRMGDVSHVVLVDRDKYVRTNVASQAITPGECGRGKAQVQALRLKRIRPTLRVTAIMAPVADVPLGRLRGDVILACVDNRAARQHLNQVSRHLGVPLIDAGVHADGMLARVSVYPGRADVACLECAWGQPEYDALEQVYPCQAGSATAAAATGAPAHLGALAGALQAIECERLLAGATPAAGGSHEVIVDAASHKVLSTRYLRNEHCRLTEHDPQRIHPIPQGPEDVTLIGALGLRGQGDPREPARLCLESQPFVTRLRCLACGDEIEMLRLRRSLTGRDRSCRRCRGRLEPAAVDLLPSLALGELPAAAHARTLRSLGLEDHDIFGVQRGDRTRYFELRGTPRAAGRS